MFSSPEAYPSHPSKSKDGVAQNTFGGTDFCGIESEPSFDIGEKLFDGPAPGETLNQQRGFEIQLGRGQISGFAFALGISHDEDPELDTGLRPPGDEGFVVEGYELAVNFDASPLPAAAGLGQRTQAWKMASLFGFAAPLSGFLSFGERFLEDGVETQAAGQRNLQGRQRFENRRIVVGAIGYKPYPKGRPGFKLSECFDRDLEPRTEFDFGAMFFGPVERNPKRQSHGNSKQLDDYGQDNPIVSPNVTGPGPFDMIPEGTGAQNVFAPLGQRVSSTAIRSSFN